LGGKCKNQWSIQAWNTLRNPQRGAESGTPGAQIDAERTHIIVAWPGLPDDIPEQILD
jgi:hypothetical protein